LVILIFPFPTAQPRHRNLPDKFVGLNISVRPSYRPGLDCARSGKSGPSLTPAPASVAVGLPFAHSAQPTAQALFALFVAFAQPKPAHSLLHILARLSPLRSLRDGFRSFGSQLPVPTPALTHRPTHRPAGFWSLRC
jgi:hypothetical protein